MGKNECIEDAMMSANVNKMLLESKAVGLTVQEKVAVKLVSRGVTNAKAAEREIANLRLCALHPYIIHLREVTAPPSISDVL